jgi:hypothetical protein
VILEEKTSNFSVPREKDEDTRIFSQDMNLRYIIYCIQYPIYNIIGAVDFMIINFNGLSNKQTIKIPFMV